MGKRRLLWQFYLSYLIIILVSLLVIAWYASRSLRQFYYKQTAADLKIRAYLVKDQFQEQLIPAKARRLDLLCQELSRKSSTRITVILPSGKVIGDSEEDSGTMDNHAERPEIRQALAGNIGTSVRFSHTLQEDMIYVAVPVEKGKDILGVLRTSIPVTAINSALRDIYAKITIAGLLVAVLASTVSLVISRRISRPLEEMRQGAERFAKGDLRHKLKVPDSQAISALAQSMNQMAAQLDERIRTIEQQRNEQEAVLASMVEGVVAVDKEERLLSLNKAAAQLLEADLNKAQGKGLHEVVRNIDLQQFVARVLVSSEPLEAEILLHKGSTRFLQLHGTALCNGQGQNIGALVVLNDVTRLRKLENIRRDFVANVSHELKTPITAISAAVETLFDGALHEPEETGRFLKIVSKQANRMNAIIEDLLTLSRIEQEAETAEILLGKHRIEDVLCAAIQTCEIKASAKNIKIELSCQDDIRAMINPPLLEQALVNLLDNAIKYSEPKSTIQVNSTKSNTEVIISVRDHGCGIGKEHLPRLFERFYRVDKARSRKLGGNGLGLAIVKHIVQAHGGKLSVESAPGVGSCFSIHLPLL
jgi:two-component system phosphate regulon sensor histidine kinase PhoR